MDSKKLHIAILSSPGLGHFIPVLVLGNRLATHHDVKVTVLAMTTSSSAQAVSQVLKTSGKQLVDIISISAADVSHLIDPETKMFTQIRIMVRETLPSLRSTIAGMKRRPDVFIGDLLSTEAFGIAAEFDMPRYAYVPSTAWFTALITYWPVLHEHLNHDGQTELVIPGCKPVQPEEAVNRVLDRNDQQDEEYLRQAKEFISADGILMNTWEDLEPLTIQAFRKNESLRAIVKPSIYPIGPLKRPGESIGPKSELIKWQDGQPNESVLYVSFGSGGNLSAQQITELAWGLELSQQRFIWVVRPPVKSSSDDSSYLTLVNKFEGSPEYLPEGFLTRTKNRGLVVTLWAPQVEILSHPSTGGFLTHCGWSSTLESLTNGVPMIAWPLYAEQGQNATMLVEELGVAVRPEVIPTKKVADRKEVEKMVRTIMESNKEGGAIREKVKRLMVSGEHALSKGGSSFNSMNEVLKDATTRLNSRS